MDFLQNETNAEVFELDFSALSLGRQTQEDCSVPAECDEGIVDQNVNQVWDFDNESEPLVWLPEFTLNPGPKFNVANDPALIFEQYFSQEFLEQILEFTNSHIIEKSVPVIDMSELRRFIGIQIQMGITRLDDERDHWSTDPHLGTQPIRETMTKDRYYQMKSLLHFYPKGVEETKPDDPLFRVRFLLDHLAKVSNELYQPSKEISIDESLVGFRGRFQHLQYISTKATKYGIKFYVLCESSTGYMLNWICYCGQRYESGSQTENIVHKLLEVIDDLSGHCLFTDNYYTSISLANKLIERGIGFTGTIRQNRKDVPLYFKKMAQKRTPSNSRPIYMRKDKLCMVAWQDKKLVLALSSNFGKGEIEVMRRSKDFDGGSRSVQIPKIINEYNKSMGGVDLYDQKLQNQAYPHRNMFWFRVIWHLVKHVAINNAYICFTKAFTANAMSAKDFKLSIAKTFMRSIDSSPLPRISSGCDKAELIKIEIEGKHQRLYCAMCKASNKPRKYVSYWCAHCHLPLCDRSLNRNYTCFQKHIAEQISK